MVSFLHSDRCWSFKIVKPSFIKSDNIKMWSKRCHRRWSSYKAKDYTKTVTPDRFCQNLNVNFWTHDNCVSKRSGTGQFGSLIDRVVSVDSWYHHCGLISAQREKIVQQLIQRIFWRHWMCILKTLYVFKSREFTFKLLLRMMTSRGHQRSIGTTYCLLSSRPLVVINSTCFIIRLTLSSHHIFVADLGIMDYRGVHSNPICLLKWDYQPQKKCILIRFWKKKMFKIPKETKPSIESVNDTL